ncbi:ABC transporter permease [Fertoebacter nigrum]|uniref:ABC transporter permease n=1 Tax=Fertoeibacter niger TaxID=2656921 RepID=A0A8X8KRR6_9RHOB|nr:ABC transporter permease [Fertoeibacter niger]NUB45547.1 ABC transporter permease [Fertoeibacter niger]
MRALRLGAGLLLALALWQALVSLSGVPPFLLPGPGRVLVALWTNRVLIGGHAVMTLTGVLIALVLGTMLGAATAVGLAASARCRAAIQPLLVVTQTIPVFALAPLLTLWLGYGLASKIAVAVLVIYFPVAQAFLDAILRTPQGWMELAQVMNATPRQVLWRIRLPAALPGLASGLRLAAVYAPLGVVLGEFVGAARGLGYLMLLANGRARIDLLFAALLVLCLLTWALHRAMEALLRRLPPVA